MRHRRIQRTLATAALIVMLVGMGLMSVRGFATRSATLGLKAPPFTAPITPALKAPPFTVPMALKAPPLALGLKAPPLT